MPHHPTSAVLIPDVPTAIEASATRADIGRLDSIININGARVHDREKEDIEKIFRRRKVNASGPLYAGFAIGSVTAEDF